MDLSGEIFQPVDHSSVAESVVSQIEGLILAGVLKDGDRLPAERELADRLGVSRPKLREALKQLDAAGLIRVRHGEGTFVARLIGSAMSPALIALYARHPDAFLDYLEFRSNQEALASGLAAERATRADKEILTSIMGNLEAACRAGDIPGSHAADIAFHAAIVDAAHNTLLIHTMSSIYALTRQNLFYSREFLRAFDPTGQAILAQHRDIFEAILAGAPEAAAQAAVRHMDFVRSSYRTAQERAQREAVSNLRQAAAGIVEPAQGIAPDPLSD